MLPLLLIGGGAYAFELLSEGDMDSVSAVSNESAEDFLNIAGPAAAGLRADFEELPFEVDIAPGEIVRDEVSTELDFNLIQEVEEWAATLRRQDRLDGEVGVFEQLPVDPTALEFLPESVFFENQVEQILDLPRDEGGSVIFEVGRVDLDRQRSIAEGFSVRSSHERFMERAAFIDQRVDFEDPTFGNAFISNVRSTTNVTFTDRTREQ